VLQKRIEELRPHELNDEIYGDEELPQDFLDSVKEKGILVSLAVKDDGTIISGHRRWRAAKAANMEAVPVSIVSFESELDEREAVITFNKQREKTFSQKMNEAEELEKIESERAKKRIKEHGNTAPGKKKNTRGNVSTGEQGKTRDKVAEKTGIGSGRTYDKAKKVWEAAKSGDEDAEKEVQKIDKGESSINKAYRKLKRKEEIEEQRKAIEQAEIERPEGVYEVIVVDPPWDYGNSKNYDPDGFRGLVTYPTMSIEEIKNIDLPTADDCILWLWTTHRHMRYAFEVIDEWGFEEKSILTWVKNRFGIGKWLRSQTEYCIMAVKGKPKVNLTNQSTVLEAPIREHSRKPNEFYDMVDKLCIGRKLDYFAREKREGWDVCGIEVDRFGGDKNVAEL